MAITSDALMITVIKAIFSMIIAKSMAKRTGVIIF
jgi:hypothetical protein